MRGMAASAATSVPLIYRITNTYMTYTKTTHAVQQLPTGGVHAIHAYTYTGSKPGPTIYLQANLHGSEVLGTRVLALFMQYLEGLEDISGTVIVVPCANPLAVQAAQYNGIAGRWNPSTGTNWNRIFQSKESTRKKVSKTMKQILATSTSSSEQRLAATLTLLSESAKYCIDLHTSGAATIPHVFRYVADEGVFDALGAPVQITWDTADIYGGFDESHVTPFVHEGGAHTYACTWELHHHNDIDSTIVSQRCDQLINWIEDVWKKENAKQPKPSVYTLKNSFHLSAVTGGYLMWEVEVGEIIQTDQQYATYYHPNTNTYTPAIAEYSFQVISTHGTYAIAQGEPIAWCVRI
jgi:predicted deacylase